MTWQNGIEWASGLGQYAIVVELAWVGALWILGALVEGLTHSRKRQTAEIDGDD